MNCDEIEEMNEIDCMGKRCPVPIIETAIAVKKLSKGERIHLLADDPATENDLNAWARMTGHHVEIKGPTSFFITASDPK